jgi:hypothetical protein
VVERKRDCGASLAMVEPRRHKDTELHEEEVLRVKKRKKEKKVAALRLQWVNHEGTKTRSCTKEKC